GFARDRDERAHAAVAGRVDLLRQRDDGELAERLRQPAHATRAPAEPQAAALARRAARVARARGRRVEHGAAGTVEVARAHVEHVDEPARQRAELLHGRADAAVHARG